MLLPYHRSVPILLLGEANFSFTKALLSLSPAFDYDGSLLVATTYDSKEVTLEKYPDAADNLKELEEAGVQVLFEVDVFALYKVKALKKYASPAFGFRYIIFNFPHVGKGIKDEERNVLANQTLLEAILTQTIPFCRQTAPPAHFLHDREEDDLAPGELHLTLKDYHPYTLWEPKKLAQRHGWTTRTSFKFDADAVPGYAHRRTIGFHPGKSAEANEEVLKGARTYCFVREKTVAAPKKQPLPTKTTGEKKRKRDKEESSDEEDPLDQKAKAAGLTVEEAKAKEKQRRLKQSRADKRRLAKSFSQKIVK